MPRPCVGNPGNKGGGRKSAYVELADAKKLEKAFLKETEKDIETDPAKQTIWDKYRLRAHKGEIKPQEDMFKKIFPDKKEHEFKNSPTLKLE